MAIIKNRLTGKVMFRSSKKTIKELLEFKVRQNANLRKADLSDADLRNADLWKADLSDADLWKADLRNADLRNADLSDANLRNANLRNANLRNANLRNANLRNANLRNANLRNADLRNADLRNADLWKADLSDADLWKADLSDADLWKADLRNANLSVEKPSIESHQFISEVLHRKAKTESQLDFSARIRIQTGCKYNWKFFIALAKKKRVLKWACKILFQWDEFREKFKKEVK
jgi:hypothetical protein